LLCLLLTEAHGYGGLFELRRCHFAVLVPVHVLKHQQGLTSASSGGRTRLGPWLTGGGPCGKGKKPRIWPWYIMLAILSHESYLCAVHRLVWVASIAS
jgi:hypothetical protein